MSDRDRPGLLGVGYTDFEETNLSDDLSWFRHRIGKFIKGGIYLLAGQPGIGKSTLAIQIALDLGRQNQKVLYILTEQSQEELGQRARMLMTSWPSQEIDVALSHIEPEEGIYDIENLPNFLVPQVLSPSGKYHGTTCIIVDSIQGHGLPSTATKKYKQLYEFSKQCKSAGITLILVAHVTKRGDIAGPKDLEHNVDCVIVMRKAMAFRPMFVPKNRFGPAVLKPVPLQMDKVTTALSLAPHSDSISTVARSYLGRDPIFPEVQAAVSLPNYGRLGRITAPGLPRKEIEQLANCISQIPDMDIDDLDYSIHCRIPGGRRYQSILGLPLSMALIASYLQKNIPSHHVYIGEIDLLRNVREVPEAIINDLWEAFEAEELPLPVRIFLPPDSATLLRETTQDVTVMACERLEDAVYGTWPEMKE